MARKRMIDPSIWDDEGVAKLSFFGRLLFIGMFSQADDYGKGRANTNFLKSKIFPYDDVRVAEVDKALSEIGHKTSVQFYEVNGQSYYRFRNWERWQKVDKPTKSVLPDPISEDSSNIRRGFAEDSPKAPRPIRIEKENNIIPPIESPLTGEPRPENGRFIKPSLEEIREYCKERKNHINAQVFFDYYESNGWKVGRTPMKDWRASIRTWEKRDAEKQSPKKSLSNFEQRDYANEELNSLFANED